jgi:hypothetical protein
MSTGYGSQEVLQGLQSVSQSDRETVTLLCRTTLRTIFANILREPENVKFQRLRKSNPKIGIILGFECLTNLLHLAGFYTDPTDRDYLMVESSTAVDSVKRAEEVLSKFEEIVAQEALAKLPLLPSRPTLAQEQERAHQQALAKIQQDRLETERRLQMEKLCSQEEQLQKSDFDSVAGLIENAKKAIHFHGRLRNQLFDGVHFTLRRMKHGRALGCECEGECLEAHWHVRTASLLYAYCVHLSPDGSSVLHSGPEYGYQYNSLPGTEHFGKTIHMSTKRILPDRSVECTNPNKPVDCCQYCQVPFRKLYL